MFERVTPSPPPESSPHITQMRPSMPVATPSTFAPVPRREPTATLPPP